MSGEKPDCCVAAVPTDPTPDGAPSNAEPTGHAGQG